MILTQRNLLLDYFFIIFLWNKVFVKFSKKLETKNCENAFVKWMEWKSRFKEYEQPTLITQLKSVFSKHYAMQNALIFEAKKSLKIWLESRLQTKKFDF